MRLWRHALISCTMARCTWALSDDDLVERMMDNTEPSAKCWIFEMHDILSQEKVTRMAITLWSIWYARWKAIILWSIWYARREALYDSIYKCPQHTDSFIIAYLMDLDSLSSASSHARSVRQLTDSMERWGPPTAGDMKFNVDGAVSNNGHKGVAAATCRDARGVY